MLPVFHRLRHRHAKGLISCATAFVVAASLSNAAVAAVVALPPGERIDVQDPASGRVSTLGYSGGYGTFTFNNGAEYRATGDATLIGAALGAFNATWTALDAQGAAVVTQQTTEDPFDPAVDFRDSAVWAANQSSLQVDTDSNQILSVALAGALLLETPPNSTSTGGRLSLSGLVLDFGRGVIRGNVDGMASATATKPAADYDSVNVDLWTFSSVIGPTRTPALDFQGSLVGADGWQAVELPGGGEAQKATLTVSGLQLTAAGFNLFTGALGLNKPGRDAFAAVNGADSGGWGQVSADVYVQPMRFPGVVSVVATIPEPSTWALMALGLVGVAAVARRRKA